HLSKREGHRKIPHKEYQAMERQSNCMTARSRDQVST
ncbi:MAG: hypothetical protein ACI9D0_001272, partial [Bacteroidia bacterium]